MKIDSKISVAPMMGYTDRHFRVLMRLINSSILLYTEMVTTGAILQGDPHRHLSFSTIERPLALQLGGADPHQLAQCAKIGERFHYDEVNLNVGCPSDRVHAGQFGACLMKKPRLVADCVSAMVQAVKVPITVKTRIGVDDQDSYPELQAFIQQVSQAGCRKLIIHARKAWLKGLSPRQNRTVPPLRYDWVYQLKKDFPDLELVINGGVNTIQELEQHLLNVDGVMIGREAYDNPLLLAENSSLKPAEVVVNYLPYIIEQMGQGVNFWRMSRHLMGLFKGRPGVKQWRSFLSQWRNGPNSLEELGKAFEPVLSAIVD